MSTHIMVDLESLGVMPGCAILSIGAVRFDPYAKEDLDLATLSAADQFYRNIDILEYQDRRDFSVEFSAIKWWFEQSEQARQDVLVDPKPLYQTFFDFKQWVESFGDKIRGVWSQGGGDTWNLRIACQRIGFPYPWSYKKDRETRTLYSLCPEVELARTENAHNALHDAACQAVSVQRCFRYLLRKGTPPDVEASQS